MILGRVEVPRNLPAEVPDSAKLAIYEEALGQIVDEGLSGAEATRLLRLAFVALAMGVGVAEGKQ